MVPKLFEPLKFDCIALIPVFEISKDECMSLFSGTNACAHDNGGCSHLCLYTPEGPVCVCPEGLVLDKYYKKCIPSKGFILFTQAGTIKKLTLGDNPKVSTLPVKGVKAYTIDMDTKDNRVYWIDEDRQVGRVAEFEILLIDFLRN